eukprot:scaffold34014_cov21-Tisochrysis_lutea.AAC.1
MRMQEEREAARGPAGDCWGRAGRATAAEASAAAAAVAEASMQDAQGVCYADTDLCGVCSSCGCGAHVQKAHMVCVVLTQSSAVCSRSSM